MDRVELLLAQLHAVEHLINDFNEPEVTGALVYAKDGKGVYVYTGLSFFRQLPAGVPGAYRLFVNLISQTRRAK